MATQTEFELEVRRIIDRIEPEHRVDTQKELESLLQAGVNSREALMATLLEPNNGEIRWFACWLLGRLEDVRARDPLMKTLRDPDSALRSEAARALGLVGLHDTIPALSDTMRTDVDPHTRMTAATALGTIGTPAVVDPLLSVLADVDEEPLVRGAAAEALIEPREMRVVPALINALKDDGAEVRYWAAFALGQLGDASAIPALTQLAATDDSVAAPYGSVKEEAEAAIQNIRHAVDKEED